MRIPDGWILCGFCRFMNPHPCRLVRGCCHLLCVHECRSTCASHLYLIFCRPRTRLPPSVYSYFHVIYELPAHSSPWSDCELASAVCVISRFLSSDCTVSRISRSRLHRGVRGCAVGDSQRFSISLENIGVFVAGQLSGRAGTELGLRRSASRDDLRPCVN